MPAPAPALRNGRSEGARGVGGCLAEAFRVWVFGRLVAPVAHFVLLALREGTKIQGRGTWRK